MLRQTYAAAGVSIAAADRAKQRIKRLARASFNHHVLTEIGSFGGLYQLPRGLKQPVLVSSMDGVGTKLKLAFQTGVHNTVGRDLVNHCVNDILVQGAQPLFFLDYIALGKMEPAVVAELVEGLSRGCRENGCVLIGGETAEMPGFYTPGEYDLAGCIVGLVERDKVLTGAAIRPGDVVLCWPCSAAICRCCGAGWCGCTGWRTSPAAALRATCRACCPPPAPPRSSFPAGSVRPSSA